MSSDTEVSLFLNEQTALIVEPSRAFFQVIQSNLTQLGMRAEKIFYANTYSDAQKIITETKPKILITEYLIGKHFGLALVEKQDELYDPLLRISIMVTKESSDNAVAEAAEEQLDAYIVKPFSSADFNKKILEVIKRKMHPSEYLLKIREGKDALKINNIGSAIAIFTEAKILNDKPTLACYYLGSCYLLKKDFDLAREYFSAGRKFNPLHYKCLTGEFDCLMQESKYKDSYDLVTLIRKNYPVTSARLGKFFIAAVYTENFSDLADFYELFTNLDYRPRDLVKLVSLALLTAGRFFIRKKQIPEALNYFEMTATVTGRDIDYIEKIIDELIKAEQISEADKFLKYVRADDIGSAKQIQLNFKVCYYLLAPEVTIEMGRKIISENIATPDITKLTVKLAVKNGKIRLAESLIIKACETHPQIRKELYEILEAAEKK